MKRALFVMVLGLGLGLGGCASDVDDPVPPAPGPLPQSEPPQQQLSANLRDPQAQLLAGIDISNGFESVPVKQGVNPPIPEPFKAPIEE